jgi:hypothetical protein
METRPYSQEVLDVFEVLDNYVREGYWNLIVYEESFSIINKELPNHNFTDDELEEITYCWLEDWQIDNEQG